MRPISAALVACLFVTTGCAAPPLIGAGQPAVTLPATGGPQILVAARGGGGAVDGMLPLPLTPCTVTTGPVEITVSLDDTDGLASARVAYGGAVRDGTLRATPEGPDITIRRRGAADEEIIELVFAEGAVRRASAVVGFTTAPPHAGGLRVTATDRDGNTTRSGLFRLGPASACQDAG